VSAKTRTNRGFTIVELVVSITLIGMLSVSLIGVFGNYLVIISRNNRMVDMTVESQNLLRATVEELRYGAGVRQTNAIADPHGPSGGWNTSNSNFVIIIPVPAVNEAGNYIIDSTTGNPYNNELVYFRQNAILFKRTLAHPNAAGNSAKSTCPAAASSPTCPPDRELTQNVDDMGFILYDQDNALTTNTLLARSVKINLSLERDTFGEPLRLDNSIRVTLRNNFL
jgi:prepilin-type N-terminal cleavage/methylation domain-containing protein